MDENTIMECVAHIRAAAKFCEDAGMLAYWASLLGVADQLLETVDISTLGVSDLRPNA
ncbi:hypothetical protein [Sphingomonas sp. Leaf357]|uniref:hypothetical protein n=1 Tax=Sphingomonas sp. Leaf357 TaxID=1736350 RepID=UPI000A705B45|nr:hypothetical protein [Sphingomonas sp. Leaf357]